MDELAWMNALAKSIGDSERGKQEKQQCPEAEARDLLARYRKLHKTPANRAFCRAIWGGSEMTHALNLAAALAMVACFLFLWVVT